MKPDSLIINDLKFTFRTRCVLILLIGCCQFLLATENAPLIIPDANIQGVTSVRVVTLEGNFRTSDRMEVSCSINHSWVGDLKLMLIAPDGTSIVIADGIGKNQFSDGCPSDNLDISFTADGIPMENISCAFSDAANDFSVSTIGSAIKKGKYSPKEPFSRLAGVAINGAWSLKIIDEAAGNKGWLLDWNISFDNEPSVFIPKKAPALVKDLEQTVAYELFNFEKAKTRGEIVIPFAVPDLMDVTLEIFDHRGKMVLHKEMLFLKGQNQFQIKKKDIGKGVFFYYIKTRQQLLSRKMILD